MEQTFKCPKCKTVYFAEQECDWCPDVITKREDNEHEDLGDWLDYSDMCDRGIG